jgi:uncharacterized protein
MLLRFLLFLVLSVVVTRAFWRVVGGIIQGLQGPTRGSDVPRRGVQMVRDPVCGTFLLPDNALTLLDGSTRVFFCSEACRDKYRARTA